MPGVKPICRSYALHLSHWPSPVYYFFLLLSSPFVVVTMTRDWIYLIVMLPHLALVSTYSWLHYVHFVVALEILSNTSAKISLDSCAVVLGFESSPHAFKEGPLLLSHLQALMNSLEDRGCVTPGIVQQLTPCSARGTWQWLGSNQGQPYAR